MIGMISLVTNNVMVTMIGMLMMILIGTRAF